MSTKDIMSTSGYTSECVVTLKSSHIPHSLRNYTGSICEHLHDEQHEHFSDDGDFCVNCYRSCSMDSTYLLLLVKKCKNKHWCERDTDWSTPALNKVGGRRKARQHIIDLYNAHFDQ